MLMYVKSQKDFKTSYKAFAQAWDVPVMASTHERGTIIIPLEGRKNFTGDFVCLDNHLYFIDESSPKDGNVELIVSDMSNLFSRKVIYPNNPVTTSYGDFIMDIIEDNFIFCPDSAYAIDYLEVSSMDTTPFEPPKLDDTRLFSLVDVIAAAREKGVLFTFYITKDSETKLDKLALDISSPITVPHNIVFDDGHTTLDTETFSRVKTAKITVMKATDTSGVYNTTTYYLSKSGNISTTVPAERAEGDWVYLTIGKNDNAQKKASEEFKKNISSHKIEFYSDKIYYLWDTVNFVIDGELLQSSVVSIYSSSDTNRYLYKCGDLATTLTEKVQKSG